MVVVSDLLKNGNFVQLLQPKIPWCWHVGVISLQNVPLECKGIKKQKERTSNKSSLPFPILTFHIQLPLRVSFGFRPNHMFWEVTNKMHRKKKTLQRDSYHTFNIHHKTGPKGQEERQGKDHGKYKGKGIRFVFVFGSDSRAASQKFLVSCSQAYL